MVIWTYRTREDYENDDSDVLDLDYYWCYSSYAIDIHDEPVIDNIIDKLPRRLKCLSIYGDVVIDVDKLVSELPNLEMLNFGRNQVFDSINELYKLPKLKHLSFHQCKLTTNKLSQLTNLQELCLNDNNLVDIRGLDKLTNLQELYLNYNYRLTEVNELSKLTKLQKLQLVDVLCNDLSCLHDLHNLRELVVETNKLFYSPEVLDQNYAVEHQLNNDEICEWHVVEFDKHVAVWYYYRDKLRGQIVNNRRITYVKIE